MGLGWLLLNAFCTYESVLARRRIEFVFFFPTTSRQTEERRRDNKNATELETKRKSKGIRNQAMNNMEAFLQSINQ